MCPRFRPLVGLASNGSPEQTDRENAVSVEFPCGGIEVASKGGLFQRRWVIVVLALCGGGIVLCLLGLVGSWRYRRAAIGRIASTPLATATIDPGSATASLAAPTLRATPSRTSTPTPTWTPRLAETAVHVPTDTRSLSTPEKTPVGTPTREPVRTATLPPTLTPTRTPSPTPMPSPTPTTVVCTDLGALGSMDIAPGQRFVCTAHQDRITEQLRSLPNVPCSDVSIGFDDGRFTLECKMGILVRAVGVVRTEECQLEVVIVEGTFGFAEAAQLMVDALLPNLPSEGVCFDGVAIDDGQMRLAGYGR